MRRDVRVVDGLIESALEQAQLEGIRGAAVTPFLLRALDRTSDGELVQTNVALVEGNADLAARIAVADAASPAPDVG